MISQKRIIGVQRNEKWVVAVGRRHDMGAGILAQRP